MGNADKHIVERIGSIFHVEGGGSIVKGYAMCMVMYDMSDGRMRKVLSDKLIRKGFRRVQMSVFMGCVKSAELSSLRVQMDEMLQMCGEPTDSIIVVPINNDTLADVSFYGKSVEVDALTEKRGVKWF